MSKTILITGASSGIGRTTAKYFQSKGWNVIATMRSPEKEEELLTVLRSDAPAAEKAIACSSLMNSCPVRFEGETGWVEAGDSGKLVLSSPELLSGRKVAEIGGYPATFHVRNFLDCVKTRAKPRANADVACYAHITCHAANVAIFLDRKVTYDTDKHKFVGDEQANRLRSEALRAPWRV